MYTSGGAKAMVAEAPRAHEHVRALRRCALCARTLELQKQKQSPNTGARANNTLCLIHVAITYILGGAKAMVAEAPRAHEHVRALRRCASYTYTYNIELLKQMLNTCIYDVYIGRGKGDGGRGTACTRARARATKVRDVYSYVRATETETKP